MTNGRAQQEWALTRGTDPFSEIRDHDHLACLDWGWGLGVRGLGLGFRVRVQREGRPRANYRGGRARTCVRFGLGLGWG